MAKSSLGSETFRLAPENQKKYDPMFGCQNIYPNLLCGKVNIVGIHKAVLRCQ